MLYNRGIVILALVIFSNTVVAQGSYKKVEDLREQWLVYDHEQNRYVPYIVVRDSHPKSISIIINTDLAKDYLVLEIPKRTSVYFNDKMEGSFGRDTVLIYKVHDLPKKIQNKILLTIFNPALKPEKLLTYLAMPWK